MKSKYFYSILVFSILLLFTTSCKKLISISPPATSISGASVFSADATAIAALTGIYTTISASNISVSGSIPSLTLYTGLSADEFTLAQKVSSVNLRAASYYTNRLSASSGYGSEFWSTIYPYIFKCNTTIEGLNGSSGLTPAVKQQLMGEAKFMRAFCYFYLVNLYGGVAMPLTSDYKINSTLARNSVSQVYQQIISDLHDAEQLLSVTYLDGSLLRTTGDRVRPTVWAAAALLARVYLYAGNWSGADSASSVVIGNASLFGISALDTAFLRASSPNREAIWQLQPVTTSPNNPRDAFVFVIPPTGPGTGANSGAYISGSLLNTFETGDQRKAHWLGSTTVSGTTYFYPFKYKINSTSASTPVTEHYMLLRLGEQFLVRAEARAHEGNIAGAQADLNIIRSRAGLGGTAASTQADLLASILHERQVEMFAELGQRWFDLKRTGAVDGTMTLVAPQKNGGQWNSYQQLYPITTLDIKLDPNLIQNAGY